MKASRLYHLTQRINSRQKRMVIQYYEFIYSSYHEVILV